MWIGIITLFPDLFEVLRAGVTGRAIKNDTLTLSLFNPRDYTTDKHQTVDDKPYGGGPGMLMKTEPLSHAIHAAKLASKQEKTKVIYLSPQGQRFTQTAAENFAEESSLILLAGRYEGIDQRVINQFIDEEWSIGDYVLTGGELPAMVMIDTIARLLPGVVGDANSVQQDSITSGLLKYPQYTRPETFNNESVPTMLLSGHHGHIETWRLKQALGTTWLKRPDLLIKRGINEEELALLQEYLTHHIQMK